MARGQVLLVREDAGVEARHDADVLPQVLVPLGGELRGHAGGGGVGGPGGGGGGGKAKGQYGTEIV